MHAYTANSWHISVQSSYVLLFGLGPRSTVEMNVILRNRFIIVFHVVA